MNVKPATTHPLATQEIDGMIDMIQTLIDKGYAYAAADGTVYFRVKKFKEYGKAVHIKIWMIFNPVSVLFRYPAKIRKKIHWILYSGNQRKKENLSGNLHGATDDRDGILSAL